MKNLILANWKMTPGSAEDAESIFSQIAKNHRSAKNEAVICPPFVYISALAKLSKKHKGAVKMGAQDCFWEKEGSYTGEVSPNMLKKMGVSFVIIGHSERRKHLGETDETVNKKVKAVLKAGLRPVMCIGEHERDEKGEYLQFVKKELFDGLNDVARKDLKNLVLAYEPIWAISSSVNARPDTPEELFEMTIYLRKLLFMKYGGKISKEVPVLYGGSVNADNGRAFLEKGSVQGLLVGRASWKAKTFLDLLKSIE